MDGVMRGMNGYEVTEGNWVLKSIKVISCISTEVYELIDSRLMIAYRVF